MEQGFTLLELLIVIAIIGLLSSIVLVSYHGSTEKARIAKTLSWAGSVSHLLGDQAVGVWTFDNISGATVYDDSGNSNNGTINKGGNGTGCNVVDGVVGKAMSFDGVDDYVDIADTAILRPGTSDWTMGAWIWASNANQAGMLTSKRQPVSPYNFILLAVGRVATDGSIYASKKISFWDREVAGKEARLVTVDDIIDGRWHYVVAVRTGDVRKIYVDGIDKALTTVLKAGTGPYNINNTNNWGIGLLSVSTYPFSGIIDDVRIYSTALPQAQIQQLYAQGLKTHQPLARQ